MVGIGLLLGNARSGGTQVGVVRLCVLLFGECSSHGGSVEIHVRNKKGKHIGGAIQERNKVRLIDASPVSITELTYLAIGFLQSSTKFAYRTCEVGAVFS